MLEAATARLGGGGRGGGEDEVGRATTAARAAQEDPFDVTGENHGPGTAIVVDDEADSEPLGQDTGNGNGNDNDNGNSGSLRPPPRKRRRIVISCTECHRRKQKVLYYHSHPLCLKTRPT